MSKVIVYIATSLDGMVVPKFTINWRIPSAWFKGLPFVSKQRMEGRNALSKGKRNLGTRMRAP